MIFKSYKFTILSKMLMLLVTLTAAAFCIVHSYLLYLVILLPVIAFQLFAFFRFHQKAQQEVQQFAEAVHYRDFTRTFDEKHAPADLQPLRKGFNEINTTFKVITREKETQFHYLQKILELVDTGILSYNINTGEVGWMNESFKKLLSIPYLKTIGSLARRDETLYADVIEIKAGEQKIVSLQKEKQAIKLLLSATAFQTDGMMYKLLAFQNVSGALDENESQAWQKLLSVMTHEIMNSVAPISSLAGTLQNRLGNYRLEQGSLEGLEDLELGIDTIKRRSEGLLKFAETYRNLSKITTLNLQRNLIRDIFENLYQLMQPTLNQKNIELEINLKDPEITLEADANLLDQVLINLLVNAIEAVKEREEPKIILSSYIQPDNRVVIKVVDNGVGIPKELTDKIFIPFFSTRKTGSGIGLSLCKQIMLLHKGNIQVQSIPGEGTSFHLQFP
jgi:two-component system, NtrC family, nitrogen regulation sensor histidine kinase NtrY